jgi:hypothetical protein
VTEGEKTAAVYQRVFNTQDGKAVLLDMLNELGYFSSDPRLVNPEKIAFANLLLGRMGILTVGNLNNYVEGLMSAVIKVNNKETKK